MLMNIEKRQAYIYAIKVLKITNNQYILSFLDAFNDKLFNDEYKKITKSDDTLTCEFEDNYLFRITIKENEVDLFSINNDDIVNIKSHVSEEKEIVEREEIINKENKDSSIVESRYYEYIYNINRILVEESKKVVSRRMPKNKIKRFNKDLNKNVIYSAFQRYDESGIINSEERVESDGNIYYSKNDFDEKKLFLNK